MAAFEGGLEANLERLHHELTDGTYAPQPVLQHLIPIAPGQAAVFPFPPQFVQPQDGQAKQDCELNAATRWLQCWGPRLAAWRITVLGDDLYCHQPFCQQVLAQGGAFLFVCLPTSHPLLYEWVGDFERTRAVPRLVKTGWTGKQRLTDTYRWLNGLPLREAGRSRWKIENNTTTPSRHLAAVLASLTLLTYLAHTVLDRLDQRYHAVRRHLPSRGTLFEHLRALAQYLPFDSWDHLFSFMLEALEPAQPPPARHPSARRRHI